MQLIHEQNDLVHLHTSVKSCRHFMVCFISILATAILIALAGIQHCNAVFVEVRDHFDPAVISKNATAILFHIISIPIIPSDLNFTHLTELTNLTFLKTGTTSIEPGAFSNGLSNLTVLRLQENGMTKLQSEVFRGLDSLQLIDLTGNEFNESVLDPEIWIDINDTLSELVLEENSFTHLSPYMFTAFKSLKVLDLFYNNISIVEPGTFNGLDSLEILDLGLNYITTLDPGAFQGLGSLTELQIGGNIITVLHTGVFIGLTSLEVLSLDFNPVEMFLTKAFQGLQSLSLLSLIDCGDLETLQWSAFDPLDVYTRGIFDRLTKNSSKIYENILFWGKLRLDIFTPEMIC